MSKNKPLDFRKTIQRAMEISSTTQYRLAKMSGVQQAALSRFFSGQSDMGAKSLEKIFDALQINFSE